MHVVEGGVGEGAEGERKENLSKAGSMSSTEPLVCLSFTTLKSGPEPKSGIGGSRN